MKKVISLLLILSMCFALSACNSSENVETTGSDMPMAVYTFLESYDFSGKTIIPFCTHEGSGLSSTDSSIAEICTGAEILEGLALRGSVAQNSQDEAMTAVTDWLDKIEILERK